MSLKLHELSPTHKLAFPETENKTVYYASNIDQVELGGGQVSGLEVYHIRNGALIVGENTFQLLPSHIIHLLEREIALKQEYGLPNVNYIPYELCIGFKEAIIQAIDFNKLAKSGLLLPFEDSENIFHISQKTALNTLNTSPNIAARLNDKVEMLTDGVNKLSNIHVPIGKKVSNREELISSLYELNTQKEFEDSILCIKVAFSASGCGIRKGHLSDLITQLSDPISDLNNWLEKSFSDPSQKVMVQEYFGNRVHSSPGVQFSINDEGYSILGASTQDFASDGVTHIGNTYSPILLQNHQLLDTVEELIKFCQAQGFKGIMGMDLLMYNDDKGNLKTSFMEFNARHTGGVPLILGASFITQLPATELTFAGGNIYTKGISYESFVEVSKKFIPNNGSGVMVVSGATIDPISPSTSKAQVIFIGNSPEDILSIKTSFEETLSSY